MLDKSTIIPPTYVRFPRLNALWQSVFLNNDNPSVVMVKERTSYFIMKYPNRGLADTILANVAIFLTTLNVDIESTVKVANNEEMLDNDNIPMLYLTALEIINDLNREFGYGKFEPYDRHSRLPTPSLRKGGKLIMEGEFKIAHLEALVVLSKVHLNNLEQAIPKKGK